MWSADDIKSESQLINELLSGNHLNIWAKLDLPPFLTASCFLCEEFEKAREHNSTEKPASESNVSLLLKILIVNSGNCFSALFLAHS